MTGFGFPSTPTIRDDDRFIGRRDLLMKVRAELLYEGGRMKSGIIVIAGAPGVGVTSFAYAVAGLLESEAKARVSDVLLGANKELLEALSTGGTRIHDFGLTFCGIGVTGVIRHRPPDVAVVHDLHHSPTAHSIAQTLKGWVEQSQAGKKAKNPRVFVITLNALSISNRIAHQLGGARVLTVPSWTFSECMEYFRTGFSLDSIHVEHEAIDSLALFSGQVPRLASALGGTCRAKKGPGDVSLQVAHDSIYEAAVEIANHDFATFRDAELEPFRGTVLDLNPAVKGSLISRKPASQRTLDAFIKAGLAIKTDSGQFRLRSGLHALALWLRVEGALPIQRMGCRFLAQWSAVQKEARELTL
jgi:hypothetical protein